MSLVQGLACVVAVSVAVSVVSAVGLPVAVAVAVFEAACGTGSFIPPIS